MGRDGVARLREAAIRRLPERHIYLRSGDGYRTFVFTTGDQLTAAAAAFALLIWTLMASGSMMIGAFNQGAADTAALKTKAYYEGLIADRQARLNSAVARLDSASGSLAGLAHSVEQRHMALTAMLARLPGAQGLARAIAPAKLMAAGDAPVARIRSVEDDQDRMVKVAETYAHTRADRLRLAFRLAGLDPASYAGRIADGGALGGPLIEAKDPRALAAVLDVDEDFADRIQHAAHDLDDARGLDHAVEILPLAKPVTTAVRTSGFGVRYDPFTHRPAFHAGQDFAGGYLTPIHSTAPGVVSFTGQRTGYGNVVEIDHSGGFKTRYAHLAAIDVRMGQRVGVGEHIAEMGSTGRSTGVHLHYEVWQNGRVQDPTRFLKAGDYVQQND